MTGTEMADTSINNHTSNSALDLSWLNESVLEAALGTKHLSLSDVGHFHESLRAAEEFGSMDHDVSERLHQKIEDRKLSLIDKMVDHETARVTKRLGLLSLLKTHTTWKQVHYMADMHGQGAYISMSEFQGLGKEQVAEAMTAFHNHLEELQGKLPFTPVGQVKDFDESARAIMEPKVAAKFCQAYRRLYNSLMDTELGGYDLEFLDKCRLHTPDELVIKFGVNGAIPSAAQDEDEILAERTDDELEESEGEE
jgi:Conserved oligomeric complex COG6